MDIVAVNQDDGARQLHDPSHDILRHEPRHPDAACSVVEPDSPKPARRPYPARYVSEWKMKDGTEVTIRPIRPDDEPLMIKFHEALSERSVFLRYFHVAKLGQRVAHERLIRICSLDYESEIALLADRTAPGTGQHEILAVGRMTKVDGNNSAELALLVRDQFQRRGLGSELMRRLIQIARDERLDSVHAHVLQENIEMRSLLRKLGFAIRPTEEPSVLAASFDLRNAMSALL